MLKAAGVVLILCAGIGFGITCCREMEERKRNLKEILRMLILLREEIRCGNRSLTETFLRMSKGLAEPFGSFAEKLAEQMQEREGENFAYLYGKCAAALKKELKLNPEEFRSFLSIGQYLGYLDLSWQLRELERQSMEFERYLTEYMREYREKKKLYCVMSAFASLITVLLFW